jgi:hypothetical protein
MTGDTDDDAVGYGRPPRATRFKPGQSGNPKGRAKHTRNFKTDLREELGERITVRENGREWRVSKQRALVKALVGAAIKGDMRAANAIVSLSAKTLAEPEAVPSDVLSPDDQDILDAFIDREVMRRKTTNEADRGDRKSTLKKDKNKQK